jgi:hypothetical protein
MGFDKDLKYLLQLGKALSSDKAFIFVRNSRHLIFLILISLIISEVIHRKSARFKNVFTTVQMEGLVDTSPLAHWLGL